jgi:hypothetical protein
MNQKKRTMGKLTDGTTGQNICPAEGNEKELWETQTDEAT